MRSDQTASGNIAYYTTHLNNVQPLILDTFNLFFNIVNIYFIHTTKFIFFAKNSLTFYLNVIIYIMLPLMEWRFCFIKISFLEE